MATPPVDTTPGKKPGSFTLFPKSLGNVIGLVVALLVIFGVFSWKMPSTFFTLDNVQAMLCQSVDIVVVTLGMTFVIISGGIDLSVGSIVAFTTVVIAFLLLRGWPPEYAALGGVASGGVCGLVNGAIITRLKVVPFIVTLGTMMVIRGAGKGIAHEQAIYPARTWLENLAGKLPAGRAWQIFPIGIWIAIFLAVLIALVLRYTRFGRHVVAIGSNEQAARLCGVPIDRVRLLVFTLSGFSAGLGGLMMFSRLTAGDPTVAVGFEMDPIAAVVIGGASLSGGEGNVVGSILGALILATIRTGCSQMGYPNWVQEIVTGLIVIVAVAIDRFRMRKSAD